MAAFANIEAFLHLGLVANVMDECIFVSYFALQCLPGFNEFGFNE